MTTLDTSTQKSNSNSRLSFHEFKKIKEDERAKKIKAKKQKTVKDVKIQIGVMEEADGCLKKVKGRTLPLMVPTNITAREILKAATTKHGRHFKQFNQQESYFLLYPDQTVVNTLPGSAEPFVLNQYKEELGKPFSKLYFWLCSTSDMENLNGDSDSSEPGPSFLTSTPYTGITVEEVEERGVSPKPNYGTSNTEVEAKASHPSLLEEIVPVEHALGYFLWRKLKYMLTYVQTLSLTLWESLTVMENMWSQKNHTELSLRLKEVSMKVICHISLKKF